MSSLNTSAITDAYLGSTELKAVYKGENKVWEAGPKVITPVWPAKEIWSIIDTTPQEHGYTGWDDMQFYYDIRYHIPPLWQEGWYLNETVPSYFPQKPGEKFVCFRDDVLDPFEE